MDRGFFNIFLLIVFYAAFIFFGVGYATGSLDPIKQNTSVWLSSINIVITGVTSAVTIGAVLVAMRVSKEWQAQKLHESRGELLKNIVTLYNEWNQVMTSFNINIKLYESEKDIDKIYKEVDIANDKVKKLHNLKVKISSEAAYLSSYPEYSDCYVMFKNIEGTMANTSAFTNPKNIKQNLTSENINHEVEKMGLQYLIFFEHIDDNFLQLIHYIGFKNMEELPRYFSFE